MRRREFITLVGGAAAWPLTAYAQKPDGVRLGILMPSFTTDPSSKLDAGALVSQLQEFGWTEGRNLRIDHRYAAGNAEQMQAAAKELVAQQPDVIFCRSTPVTAAILTQTRTIPIVFAMVSDPVGERFVESLARPGGNATGFTILSGGTSPVGPLLQATRSVPIVFVHVIDPVGSGTVNSLPHPGGNATGFSNMEYSLSGKWLELLKEIAPGVTRVAVLRDATQGFATSHGSVATGRGQPPRYA